MVPDPIPNASLRLDQIPAHRATLLDPQNFSGGHSPGRTDHEWEEIWTFALTFDGYSYFGGDGGAVDRVAHFGRSIRRAFEAEGEVPIRDLALVRTCLFAEQRDWCKWGDVWTQRCPPNIAAYLDGLLERIRRAVSS